MGHIGYLLTMKAQQCPDDLQQNSVRLPAFPSYRRKLRFSLPRSRKISCLWPAVHEFKAATRRFGPELAPSKPHPFRAQVHMQHTMPIQPDPGLAAPMVATAAPSLDDIAFASVRLGHDIVDVTGFLDAVLQTAKDQSVRLEMASTATGTLSEAGLGMIDLSERLSDDFTTLSARLAEANGQLRTAMTGSRDVIGWVFAFASRLGAIDAAMLAAQKSNQRILRIAREVNILAINARIEAARAGAAGSGFGIIAEAVNKLSGETERAARDVTDTIQSLAGILAALQSETVTTAQQAQTSLAQSTEADEALGTVARSSSLIASHLADMREGARRMRREVDVFGPTFHALEDSVLQQKGNVEEARNRVGNLITQSESLMQGTYALGGRTDDRTQIRDVRTRAETLGQVLEAALDRGEISLSDLFSTVYTPIPGTNPEQVMAPFTALTDRLFPPVQETALEVTKGAIFCAAVDRNGYLPTHNHKFSHPQGADPVWNAANCRNRRIFDDRVGLAAGRSTEPFLMQIYRRDMGGGVFKMMKDVSAPIFVKGRHWGGLRLAYSF
jgi:methyl-accepting chemotaxis protein